FVPEETMHPFAIAMRVRTADNGAVAAISGSTLVAKAETHQTGRGSFAATTLNADRPFASSIRVQNGTWIYKSAAGSVVDSAVLAGGQWHQTVPSHSTARGETLIYADGRAAGKVAERLEPNRFAIGGPDTSGAPAGPRRAEYKDLMLYRSALNADEAA